MKLGMYPLNKNQIPARPLDGEPYSESTYQIRYFYSDDFDCLGELYDDFREYPVDDHDSAPTDPEIVRIIQLPWG